MFVLIYLCPQIHKNKIDYGGYINRAQYLRGTASPAYASPLSRDFTNVSQMKAMTGRGTDKRLGEWLDNQDVCQILNISPKTLQTLRQNGTFLLRQAAKPSGHILKLSIRLISSIRKTILGYDLATLLLHQSS